MEKKSSKFWYFSVPESSEKLDFIYSRVHVLQYDDKWLMVRPHDDLHEYLFAINYMYKKTYNSMYSRYEGASFSDIHKSAENYLPEFLKNVEIKKEYIETNDIGWFSSAMGYGPQRKLRYFNPDKIVEYIEKDGLKSLGGFYLEFGIIVEKYMNLIKELLKEKGY